MVSSFQSTNVLHIYTCIFLYFYILYFFIFYFSCGVDVVDPTVTNKLGVFLVLHGVDTIAQIHLNGIFLGETDNMFVRYRFNVRNLLKVND